jgi:hypothetical protein
MIEVGSITAAYTPKAKLDDILVSTTATYTPGKLISGKFFCR